MDSNYYEPLYMKTGSGKRTRYVPVAHTIWIDHLTPGAHLVLVGPTCRSTLRNIDPKYAEVEAALKVFSEAVAEAMCNANRATPSKTRIADPEKAARAWAAYTEIYGPVDSILFDGVSMMDLVEAGVAELRKHLLESDNDNAVEDSV